ncbi:GNAT family N-acetyltransferase [Leifsonia sp. NPDC058230]|uniref:GNAT family N-acetyltransferase n=1 Tax=Leifsonia sp. NPDC058230 TaxID=3346391 RepID=UPI0036DF12AE
MAVAILRFRAGADGDAPFIRELFAQTRGAEFALAGLSPDAVDQLVDLQLRAQSAQVAAEHPDARTTVIEKAGTPVGAVVVDRSSTGIHLVDLTIAAGHRREGIGSAVLRELAAESDESELPLTLHVWANNQAAIGLYKSFGFETVGERSGYDAMRREPSA